MNTAENTKVPHFTLSGGDDNGASYEGVFDNIYETEESARKDAAAWVRQLDGEELFSGATCHRVTLWRVNTVNEDGEALDSEPIESWSVGGCRVVAGKHVEIPFSE